MKFLKDTRGGGEQSETENIARDQNETTNEGKTARETSEK